MVSCCILGCPSRTERKTPNITFFTYTILDTSHTDHSHNKMGHVHDSHDLSMHTGHQHTMAQNNALNFSHVSSDIARQGHGGMNHGVDHSSMDHSSMGHGTMDHGAGHMMNMTFHGGSEEIILFSWWQTTDAAEFVGSFFAIFIMALLYEGLKYYRKHLLWKTYTGLQYCAVSPPDKGVANICAPDEPQVIQPVPHTLERNVPTMLSTAHAWQTMLHGVQVLVSYMLMLVFMTYNVWLCAAVVFGSATGYFLFGWRESVVVDFTEHCH